MSGFNPRAQGLRGRIQDFFKEGGASMRVRDKHPRAKGMGEGGVGG